MAKKLSVIIPCYNHGKYLPDALNSLDKSPKRDQVEVIIINDGSTDTYTNNYISALDAKKYVIINQKNQGLAKARNNGILHAKADFVLMLDADNYIEEVFLEDFFELINKGEEFDALYGDARFFGEENKIRAQGQIDLFKLLNDNHIDACAILNKNTLLKVGLYDANMPYMGWEDWDMWLRLAFEKAAIHYNAKVYFNYRVCSSSMIRAHNNDRFLKTRKYLLVKHLEKRMSIEEIAEFLLTANKGIIEKLVQEKNEILNSKTYKIGNLIVSPYRHLKALFKKFFRN